MNDPDAKLIPDISERQARLQQLTEDALKEARAAGASAAEAAASNDAGLSVVVRLGEVETIEHTRDNGLGVTVYFGHRKGSASTSDLSSEAMRHTVRAACNIARYTQEDPCAGPADPEFLANELPDLDLYHPWDLPVQQAIEHATACEQAARDLDPRITNSEGATLNSQAGVYVYGNTHGFIGGAPGTRHSMSCAVIGQLGDAMQRDYWWSTARSPQGLERPDAVGRKTAERTLSRLGARKITTRQAPVLFQAEVAVGLLRHLVSAIQGSALYRQASFLLDQLGEQIFPAFVRIHENPRLPGELGSAAFDSEGVATQTRDLVSGGILRGYALDSYSACRLGLVTTGNAGGVRNLRIDGGALDRAALLREMDTGLLVTELMGQGVNQVTGDYSRGAAGFWVERGEVQFPVEEITIAGNLKDMFRNLVAVGCDADYPGSTRTGSWLIEQMTIAGD